MSHDRRDESQSVALDRAVNGSIVKQAELECGSRRGILLHLAKMVGVSPMEMNMASVDGVPDDAPNPDQSILGDGIGIFTPADKSRQWVFARAHRLVEDDGLGMSDAVRRAWVEHDKRMARARANRAALLGGGAGAVGAAPVLLGSGDSARGPYFERTGTRALLLGGVGMGVLGIADPDFMPPREGPLAFAGVALAAVGLGALNARQSGVALGLPSTGGGAERTPGGRAESAPGRERDTPPDEGGEGPPGAGQASGTRARRERGRERSRRA